MDLGGGPGATRRTLTAVLVDDDELAVAGLQALLAEHPDRVRLVEVRDALAQPHTVDVVLHEPLAASGWSTHVLRDLQEATGAPTVAFSWAAVDALPTEPDLYLSKSSTGSQIVRAIEDLHDGRELPTPRTSGHTAPGPAARTEPASSTPRDPSEEEVGLLTPRELDIMVLITRGHTNPEIADQLGLSVNSIKTYIRQAYRKLGLQRRTQAVSWGIAHGLETQGLSLAV